MTDDIKRVDSWIDKQVSLKTILRDQRALDAFRTFCASIFATENLSFYVAVEYFKSHYVGTPKTGTLSRKTYSLANLKADAKDDAELAREQIAKESNFLGTKPRHSVMMSDLLTPEAMAKLSLNDTQTAMLKSAVRIFTTFLEDGAEQWACVDSKFVDEVRDALKRGTDVDVGLFDKCQQSVFQSMQADLLPRFLKALFEDPQQYASGQKRSEYSGDEKDKKYVQSLIMEAPDLGGPSSPRVKDAINGQASLSSSRVSMKLEPPVEPKLDL